MPGLFYFSNGMAEPTTVSLDRSPNIDSNTLIFQGINKISDTNHNKSSISAAKRRSINFEVGRDPSGRCPFQMKSVEARTRPKNPIDVNAVKLERVKKGHRRNNVATTYTNIFHRQTFRVLRPRCIGTRLIYLSRSYRARNQTLHTGCKCKECTAAR